MLEMTLLVGSSNSHATIQIASPVTDARGHHTCDVRIIGLSKPVMIKSHGETTFQALHHALEIVRLNIINCKEFLDGNIFLEFPDGTVELFTADFLGDARY